MRVTLGSLMGRDGMSSHPGDSARACRDQEPRGDRPSVARGGCWPLSGTSGKAGAVPGTGDRRPGGWPWPSPF